METKYTKEAENILNFVGSKENILSIGKCSTRLRLELKDNKKVNISIFGNVEGVLGVIETEGQLQIIVDPIKSRELVSEFIKIYQNDL